ncbi:PAS domain-containing protein [Streptomyces sp. NPDC051776]|uniref:PAS domain-containing protein n=1 Tax=Streptomyces sp. NPDC051776 TaxID=3155414 RepID=UPI003427011B
MPEEPEEAAADLRAATAEAGAAERTRCAEAIAWRNRFLMLFDRMPLAMALCRTDGEILLANPALGAEWGLPAGRLTGRNVLDLFHPRASAQLERIADALRVGRRSRYPLAVGWTSGGADRRGELTVDPVSEGTHAVPALLVVLRSVDAAPREAAERGSRPRDDGEVGPVGRRVLSLAAAGLTTAAIAKATGLTVDGVNYHVTRLSRRWRTPNRTALVAKAYALGVLSPGHWPPAAGPVDA